MAKLMSIMILNWNRLHYTKRTLEKIIERTTVPHELIFIDNGSKDGTIEYLISMKNKTNAVKTKYIFNEKNLGVSAGRNSGLIVAEGDYLVNIDDDVIVPKAWDILMATACDKIPKLGITGVNVEGSKYPIKTINGVRVQQKNGNLGGACLCLPKRVFDRIGYYNTEFGQYGMEDNIMFDRLRRLGLISAYIEPKGHHIDKDEDKQYRAAKSKIQSRGSPQMQMLGKLRRKLKETGNVYVPYTPYDPDQDPKEYTKFDNDLILQNRKGK